MDNTNLFSGKASVYHSARAAFPEMMIDFIFDNFIGGDKVIADIGSGSGKLTKQLLSRGTTVYAVEPNEDMRLVAEDICGNYNNFVSVNATAEDTRLSSGSIDVITAARAFHWFDREKFLAECKRILGLDGRVLILTNGQDKDSLLFYEQDSLLRNICPRYLQRHNANKESDESSFDGFFAEAQKYTWNNDIIRDKQAYIDDLLSKSYAPSKCDSNYAIFIKELSSLFDKHAINGKINVQSFACLYTGEIV